MIKTNPIIDIMGLVFLRLPEIKYGFIPIRKIR